MSISTLVFAPLFVLGVIFWSTSHFLDSEDSWTVTEVSDEEGLLDTARLLPSLQVGNPAAGQKKNTNPVAMYLKKAELQYEGEVQRDNILDALHDILTLAPKDLKARRYMDYQGSDGRWDLPTLIYRHFVPYKKNRSLGANFYKDVKTTNVQKKVKTFIDEIEKS